jgi:hypothetical protein
MLQSIPKEETSDFRRPVLQWVCELNYDIEHGRKICDSCRKFISKEGTADYIVQAR